MKKRLRKFSVSLVVLLLVGELVARFFLGLGETPVFIEDSDYEYIYAPNQSVARFGNRIATNAYSMRSKAISKNDKLTILKIGDSIINGGSHVDQDSLSTSHLEVELQAEFKDSIRVLNISAASWGPSNAMAYINKHGHFNASMMVLVFSSHDYKDNMHFRKVVGKHKAWPAEQPLLALTDGWSKYVWPNIKSLWDDEPYEETYLKGFDDSMQNPGWQDFIDYAKQNNIELLIYIHPEKEELANKKYNGKGQAIIQFLSSQGIKPLQGLNANLTPKDYQDHIHLNAAGHRKMANYLYPHLSTHTKKKL